jgi:Protein of unknown function (DUF3168)
MILNGLYRFLTTSAVISPLLAAPASNSVVFSVAQKQPGRPFVVLHVVNAAPAEKTQDGSSALIEGELQFDSYADNQLMARGLSQAIRDNLVDFTGPLPDGTILQFAEVSADFDDPYELGGGGYIHRAVLRLKALYTENYTVQSQSLDPSPNFFPPINYIPGGGGEAP